MLRRVFQQIQREEDFEEEEEGVGGALDVLRWRSRVQ
jgi:hypothetical protein